jgi:hypothetical protein
MVGFVGIAHVPEAVRRLVNRSAVCTVCKVRGDRDVPWCLLCREERGQLNAACRCGECVGRWFERTRGVS